MYNHRKIEQKWQEEWQKDDLYKTGETAGQNKYYVLDMFPYPSGVGLHVGHPRGYIATDVLARYKMLRGFNVLHPMGWDAFGLPAENYALANKVHPKISTDKNIVNYKRQLNLLGLAYDWSREINTTDPEYYKWTQWAFIQMFKKGLVYESHEPINWCPTCLTGLANEDVEDGRCERCGTLVEKRPMRQWVIKITDYAERLLNDLEKLPDWEEPIKTMQRNWIGKSEGAEIQFSINNSKLSIKVFTTRPDTIFGATYMVICPEHESINNLQLSISNYKEVKKYIDKVKNKSDLERTDLNKDKTGVELKGIKAINPATKEEIPIFVADYVLPNYGTGAIMAVPAHDERDYEFAKKYNLSIKEVVEPVSIQTKGTAAFKLDESFVDSYGIIALVKHWSDDKYIALRWPAIGWGTMLTGGVEDGLSAEETVLKEIQEETGYKNAVIVRKIANIHSKYYHAAKKANRFGHTPAFYVELKNDESSKVSAEEIAKHEVLWLNKDELKKFLTAESHLLALDLFDNPVYSENGVLINSDFLNGLETKEAKTKIIKWLQDKTIGAGKVQYKLKDWVFSRQRYWGEPIPLIHCPHCQTEIETKAQEIKFYNQDTWSRLVSGHKTIETRALNPEESDRYFGKVKIGDYLKAKNMETGQVKYFSVVNNWQFNNLTELFGQKDILRKIRAPYAIPKTLAALAKSYAYTADYVDRINANGLIAWEVAMVTPGVVPVPEAELPLKLPEVEHYEPSGTGESPLANIKDWVNTKCPKCGGPAKRETNTMPQWAGSSWYYLRYCDPHNNKELVAKDKAKYWLGKNGVDFYVGGAEHATRHLIYARFWHKFLQDIGVVSTAEPFIKYRHVGLILAEDNRKMSKRWNNVINPDEVIISHGADALRVYEMFMGPFSEAIAWNTNGLSGARKFLEKIYKLKSKILNSPKHTPASGHPSQEGNNYLNLLHKTIKKVGSDIENFKFNTAVSALMILVNKMTDSAGIAQDDWQKFLVILAPFAPHLAEELWQVQKSGESIFKQPWPKFDPKEAKDEVINLVVQINGKLRDTIEAPADIGEAEAKALALKSEKIIKWLAGQEPEKIVYVKGRLINIVVK